MKIPRPPQSRLLAAAGGAALCLSAPPTDAYFLGWIGLVPLFLALKSRTGSGFGEGFVAGFVFNVALHYWLALNNGTYLWVAILTMFAAAFILATGWGVAAWAFCRLEERLGIVAWLSMPFTWTAWEGLLTYLGIGGELGFPWPLLALTQAGFDPLIQIMEFTGTWGVSFWVVAINLAVYFIWKGETKPLRRRAFTTFIALVLIPPVAIWHAVSHYRTDAPVVKVAVIQGNIPPLEKWILGAGFSLTTYDSLTSLAAERGVDLVVWPETAMPINLMHQSHYYDRLTRIAEKNRVAGLTGASDHLRVGGEPQPLNAAFLILPERGAVARYSKMQLVPFGERVPFQKIIPSLGKLNLGQAEFLPGPRWTLFETELYNDTVRFPALICFESAFPNLSRHFVLQGANFLTTISNDSWYGFSSEPSQIAALSRFRSIETRRAMARSSNSGVSFICDQLGRVIAHTDLFKASWVGAIVPLSTEITFYVRYGDWLVVVSAIVYGFVLILAATKRKRIYA